MRLRAESLPYVEVQEISPASLPIPVRSPGRVAFRDEAVSRVGAPLDGRVQEVHVRIGEHVDAGQPLVTLASPGAASVRAQLVQARVAVRAAEAELERQTAMQERGVGVRSEEVAAEARLAEARALLAGLQSTAAMIGRGSSSAVVVRAPIAGTVLARAATPGASVEAGGDALVELGEPSALRVIAYVFERELPLVREGAAARIEVAGAREPLAARVERVVGTIDPETRRAEVYLAAGASGGLRAGMFARVVIDGDPQDGLAVPATAVLLREGGRSVVYVAGDDLTFEARDVGLGHPVDGRVPVLSGLIGGERVVVRGALLLDATAEQLL